jgi:zinc-ribbon domain
MSTGTTNHTTGRTAGRTVRYAVGAVLLVGGIVCVVWGFSTFTGSALDGSGDGAGRSMALFAGGGLATVVGFGLVAFTRVGALTGRGGYARVTYEQGYGVPPAAGAPATAAGAAAGTAPAGTAPVARSHCTSCGAAVAAEDRFCGACGSPLQRAAGLA